jgi:predicted phosphodiesterase
MASRSVGKTTEEILTHRVAPAVPASTRQKAPAGYEPGVAWDGSSGELSTGPVAGPAPTCWDDLLRRWDLDPADVEVIEPVQRRSWEAQGPDGIVTLNYFKASLRRRRTGGAELDELFAQIRRHRPNRRPAAVGDLAYVQCSGDLQAGKADGDGTEGMVARFLESLDTGARRVRELRAAGLPVGPIYLPWLGDCIEHIKGHYAQQAFTVELTLTEQIRLVRRLMLKQIQTFAQLTDRLVVPIVPGNHDEAHRNGAGKSDTTFSDSFAIEIGHSVADVLNANPDAYGHVSIVLPAEDRLDLTLDIAGTTTGMVHGHQFGSGERAPINWWARQAHGRQLIGDATVLLAGHLHHLRIHQDGAKSFIQVPSIDGGSIWWEQKTGTAPSPGIVSYVSGDISPRGWGRLEVL